MNLRLYELLRKIVNIALAIISFFLVMRIILRFFSTNPSTPFVRWILSVSNFLMAPFVGIVPNISTSTGILDTVAIITLLVYLIVGYVLLSIIDWMAGPQILEDEYSSSHYHEIPYPKKYRYPNRREEYDL